MNKKEKFSPERYFELLKNAHTKQRAKIKNELIESENTLFKSKLVGKDVLVGGSGLGHDAYEISTVARQVIGIEIIPEMVQHCYSWLMNETITNLTFQQGDFTNLKQFPDKFFDASTLNMGVITNYDDITPVVSEMTRVAGEFYATFYIPGVDALERRIAMYKEEGVVNPGVMFGSPKETIVSDDGHYSRSIYPAEIADVASKLEKKVLFHHLTDYAMMAQIH